MADGGDWAAKQWSQATEPASGLLVKVDVEKTSNENENGAITPSPVKTPTSASPMKSPVGGAISPTKSPISSPLKSPVGGAISPTKSPISSPLKTPADDPPSLSPLAPSPLKSPMQAPKAPTMPIIVSSPKPSAANGPNAAHSPKTPITSPLEMPLDASNAAPDHSPINPGATYKAPKFASPGASLSPPNQSSVSSNVSVGTSPASVVGAPRSPYDITNNTPLKGADKKSITDRLRDLASNIGSKFKKTDKCEEERLLLAIDFDGTISDRNTYSAILRRMMISAEEMPADMTKERDELNQPKNRQSLQPFYSKVIAYLAEHAKMDKSGLLDWLKDQMRPAPGMVDLLCMAVEAPNIDVAIFSDSNNLFIETLLEHWHIPTHSITIVANGTTNMTTPDGLEYIALYDNSAKKVDCRYCRTNLCKGTLLKEFKKTRKYSRTIIVGDGEGDVCMALHGNTSSDDFICARRPRHSSSSASLASSSSLSTRAMSGLQLSLCKIDIASELSRGPSKNLGLKPAIDTNQLIYTDGRQLLRLLSLPLPLDDATGEPLNLPELVSVYEFKLELIEKEKERQKNDKTAPKRSVNEADTSKKVEADQPTDGSK